jgi:hypothetical protein
MEIRTNVYVGELYFTEWYNNRPRHRCVNIIKIDLGEIGWGGVDWSYLA